MITLRKIGSDGRELFSVLNLLELVVWIDDDFMSDENIEFDFEAFDSIDSGEKYLNPKHFSLENSIDTLQ